jgi:glucosamine-6-phosphate deaminase
MAARYIARAIKDKPDSVLGFATGETTRLLYAELVRMHKEEGLDFSKIYSFNLDEFVGLEEGDSGSYRSCMHKHLFDHVNVNADRVFFPDVKASDIPSACAAYEAKISELGGIDVQVLGIGVEGHIGFNEPTSSLASRTRIKTLTHRTIQELSRNFPSASEVPSQVLTMGVGTIMDSKKVVLMATGQEKAEIIRRTIEGPITALVPASALQMHQVTKVFLDAEASQSLTLKPYYRWAFQNKPEWQRFDV